MASLAEKLLGMMRLSDTDEDVREEDFEQEYEEYDEGDSFEDIAEEDEPEELSRKKSVLSFRRKKKNSVTEDSQEVSAYSEPERRVIPFNGVQEEGEIVKVIKPQEFNEAQIVADFLKEGKTIVVNLEGIEISQAQRIIDFIGGASFAVDGSLKAISNNIFIVAPGNIEVSGDLRDEIISDSMLSPELSKF